MAKSQPNDHPLNSPEGRRALMSLLLICAHPDCPQDTLDEARAALSPWFADLMELLDPPSIPAPTTSKAFLQWAIANYPLSGDFDSDRDHFAQCWGEFFVD